MGFLCSLHFLCKYSDYLAFNVIFVHIFKCIYNSYNNMSCLTQYQQNIDDKKNHSSDSNNVSEKTRGLFWVVAFDVGLNQRSMRERALRIVDIRIRVVVKQNNRLVLRDDTNRCYQFL